MTKEKAPKSNLAEMLRTAKTSTVNFVLVSKGVTANKLLMNKGKVNGQLIQGAMNEIGGKIAARGQCKSESGDLVFECIGAPPAGLENQLRLAIKTEAKMSVAFTARKATGPIDDGDDEDDGVGGAMRQLFGESEEETPTAKKPTAKQLEDAKKAKAEAKEAQDEKDAAARAELKPKLEAIQARAKKLDDPEDTKIRNLVAGLGSLFSSRSWDDLRADLTEAEKEIEKAEKNAGNAQVQEGRQKQRLDAELAQLKGRIELLTERAKSLPDDSRGGAARNKVEFAEKVQKTRNPEAIGTALAAAEKLVAETEKEERDELREKCTALAQAVFGLPRSDYFELRQEVRQVLKSLQAGKWEELRDEVETATTNFVNAEKSQVEKDKGSVAKGRAPTEKKELRPEDLQAFQNREGPRLAQLAGRAQELRQAQFKHIGKRIDELQRLLKYDEWQLVEEGIPEVEKWLAEAEKIVGASAATLHKQRKARQGPALGKLGERVRKLRNAAGRAIGKRIAELYKQMNAGDWEAVDKGLSEINAQLVDAEKAAEADAKNLAKYQAELKQLGNRATNLGLPKGDPLKRRAVELFQLVRTRNWEEIRKQLAQYKRDLDAAPQRTGPTTDEPPTTRPRSGATTEEPTTTRPRSGATTERPTAQQPR